MIEIAGRADTSLAGWTLVLYNGADGLPYSTVQLPASALISNQLGGFGTVCQKFTSSGVQNGPADGLALVNASGGVVEFLSYEGTLTAVGGPADGMNSTDLGVLETGTTAIGTSISL